MAVAAFLLPVVLAGCSVTRMGDTDPEKGVYAAEDLDKFKEDTSTLVHAGVEDEYVIGVGDQLDIVFLFHNNLTTRDLIVRRDGRISLPYVGDEPAAGLTPMILDSMLTDHFGEILRDPNLSVIVRQPAEQKVYVLGEVEQPGRYVYDDELSIVQSIAMAGGLKKSGSGGNAVLIRRQGMDRIVGIEVDVKGIMLGAQIQNDLRLRNYDIIYVPKKPLYSAADFMQAINDIVAPPVDWVFKGWQIKNLNASIEFFGIR